MVAVREITWEEASAPDFENPARHAWREAVAEVADKAKATLPECNGRVEKAAAIVGYPLKAGHHYTTMVSGL